MSKCTRLKSLFCEFIFLNIILKKKLAQGRAARHKYVGKKLELSNFVPRGTMLASCFVLICVRKQSLSYILHPCSAMDNAIT